MIAILKVGTSLFAMEPKDASKVLELLSKSMRVEQAWHGSRVYFHPPPERDYRDELSLSMVDPNSILSAEPTEDKPLPARATPTIKARYIGARQQRPLLGFKPHQS